jgi:hypothetical protein
MDVTRRSLARTTAKMLAVAAAIPQHGVSQTNQAADADLEAARELLRANLQQIAKVKLPMATEPAFVFKA